MLSQVCILREIKKLTNFTFQLKYSKLNFSVLQAFKSLFAIYIQII
jgi:hypothetical protein